MAMKLSLSLGSLPGSTTVSLPRQGPSFPGRFLKMVECPLGADEDPGTQTEDSLGVWDCPPRKAEPNVHPYIGQGGTCAPFSLLCPQ